MESVRALNWGVTVSTADVYRTLLQVERNSYNALLDRWYLEHKCYNMIRNIQFTCQDLGKWKIKKEKGRSVQNVKLQIKILMI